MTLSDRQAYGHVIGCLMRKPLLFLEYTDIRTSDFDFKPARICFNVIYKMYCAGATELIPLEVDQEIERCGGATLQAYKAEEGLDFLKKSYEYAQLGNFEMYYNRLKKCSLLRKLQKAKYDISEFYLDEKDIKDPLQEVELNEHFDNSSI